MAASLLSAALHGARGGRSFGTAGERRENQGGPETRRGTGSEGEGALERLCPERQASSLVTSPRIQYCAQS